MSIPTPPQAADAAAPVVATAGKNRKITPRLKIADKTYPANTVVDGQNILNIGKSPDTIVAYLAGFRKLTPAGTLTNTVNSQGFSNPSTPSELGPQAVLKAMAVLIDRAAQITLEGDEQEKKEIADGLAGILSYQKTAVEQAKVTAAQVARDTLWNGFVKLHGDNVEKAKAAMDAYLNQQSKQPNLIQKTA